MNILICDKCGYKKKNMLSVNFCACTKYDCDGTMKPERDNSKQTTL